MKIVVTLLFAAFLMQAKAQSTGSPQDAIIAAMKTSENDWNSGNLDNFMKMYTDSSTMMYPTGPVGLSAIRDLYATKYFNGKMPKQNLYYSEMKVTMLGSKYALLTGKFTLKGGNLPERSGRYSLVMVLTDEGWKILHDHSG
ncbi:MAG TPA: nuclear transport factor 2 family protein [Mucilaginibacter sp.]|nr:nuclear transport factor 2 family protein [Mucilaginibacter sp.]